MNRLEPHPALLCSITGSLISLEFENQLKLPYKGIGILFCIIDFGVK